MRVSRVPTLLAQRQKRREQRSRSREDEAVSPAMADPLTSEQQLRNKSSLTSIANLVLEDIPMPASTTPTPAPMPTPTSPSRRRSFMQSISSSSQSREPSLAPPTRQGTFRGMLSRNSTSSISGHLPSPVPEYLGLNSVYSPPSHVGPPEGDIVFVHGLGGSPFETWSWARDTVNFWPPWLAEGDDTLAKFRILTFGYNSNFKGESTNLEIIDFAKDLLMQMLTFGDGIGTTKPVFFVAHSMGGLVVKKAILLGMHDRKYTQIVDNVSGVMFLATPHRGAQYAKMLNNILSTTAIGPGSKPYVSELERQSTIIQDINENFRQHCHKLTLVSFYETLKTSFPLAKIILVDKESAVLGYSNEMSASMDADHHSICKFKNQSDVNYLKVKGIIKKWAVELREAGPPVISTSPPTTEPKEFDFEPLGDWRKTLRTVLGILEHNELEMGTIRAGLSPSSGSWLYQRSDYRDWLRGDEQRPEQPSYFWLLGLPGNGKTSLATCVVSNLLERGENVQYHFFSASNQRKKTISYCLRSIAMQLALTNETFRNAVIAFGEETGISFSNHSQTFHIIWDKLFEGIIFRMKFPRPLVWVIDGVDESDSPNTLLMSLARMRSVSPIRIFLTSRPSKGLALFKDLRLTSYFLQQSDTAHDIRNYTISAVKTALPDDESRQKPIVDQILRQASGNFLWVKLALDSLQECWHTEEDIRLILTEAPRGMVSMYKRMLDTIKGQSPRNQTLARRILTWAACSWRPLTIVELEAALSAEFSGLINLESTIAQICGNFITINRSNPFKPRVNLIHSTARDFLLNGDAGEEIEAFVNAREGHQHLAITCLAYLSHDRWRRLFGSMQVMVRRCSSLAGRGSPGGESEERLRANSLVKIGNDHPLLAYCTSYWAYHVCNSPTHSANLNQALDGFFQRYCLSWIEAIALAGNLPSLVTTAQYLKAYVKRCDRKRRAGTETYEGEGQGVQWKTRHLELSFRRIDEEEEDATRTISAWANDFIRLSAKFSPSLTRDPSSIYKKIPPFCPKQSMIWQTYGNPSRPGSLQHQPTFPLSSSTSSLALTGARSSSSSSQLCVTGLPSENWNDCLATVSVGCNDDYITQVLASQTHLVGLVSSTGTVKVWNSHTCELLRTITQGEYVRFMTLNRTGTLLATAGFQSFCIWEVSSGRRLYRMSKSTNAMVLSIAFGASDSELVVGLDNGSVMWLDMETGTIPKTFTAKVARDDYVHGCPVKMALSSDLRFVAMAWRGRPPMVWDLSAPLDPPIRCTTQGSSDSINAPEQLVWRPDTCSLLVLCQNTSLVEWRICNDVSGGSSSSIMSRDAMSLHNSFHPHRDRIDEEDEEDEGLTEFRHIRCWQMSVSADGRFLLTNDTSKTISVWTFPGLNLAYRLLNVDDLVSDLTFSPDCQRFYDARGAMCNVWEPDALVPTDGYEHISDDHGPTTPSGCETPCEPVLGHNMNEGGNGSGRRSVVTAMDLDATGRYFCAGREDGSVQIHDASSGIRLRRVYGHSTSAAVVAMSWSASGRFIVSCDESARVVAKRLQLKDEDKWAVFPVFDCRLAEPVKQFVFNPSETHLLVSTSSTDQVWDLKNKHLIHVQRWGEHQPRRWLQNPSDPGTLLWIDPMSVKQYTWPTLTLVPEPAHHHHYNDHLFNSNHHYFPSHHHDDSHFPSLTPSPTSARSFSLSPTRGTWSRRTSTDVQRVKVTWVAPTSDGRCAVFATVPDDGRLWLSDTTLVAVDLAPGHSNHHNGLRRRRILRGLEERVKLLVGMHGNNLVFLDRDSWLCTWDASTGNTNSTNPSSSTTTLNEEDTVEDMDHLGVHPAPSSHAGFADEVVMDVAVTRHFFIPKDWLVTYTVPIPRINAQGTFFYPKYGDVAVVWNGVRL